MLIYSVRTVTYYKMICTRKCRTNHYYRKMSEAIDWRIHMMLYSRLLEQNHAPKWIQLLTLEEFLTSSISVFVLSTINSQLWSLVLHFVFEVIHAKLRKKKKPKISFAATSVFVVTVRSITVCIINDIEVLLINYV